MVPITAFILIIPFVLTAHVISVGPTGVVSASPTAAVVCLITMGLLLFQILPRWFGFVRNQIEKHDWKKSSMWRRLYAGLYKESPVLAHTASAIIAYVYLGFPMPWCWSGSSEGRRLSIRDPNHWGGLVGEMFEYHLNRDASREFDVLALFEACHESMGEMMVLVGVLYVTYAEYVRRRPRARVDIADIPPPRDGTRPTWCPEWAYPALLWSWDLLEVWELWGELCETGPNPNQTEAGLAFIISIVSTISELRDKKAD